SLEQFPLAVDHNQLGGVASGHGRAAGLLGNGSRNRLVDHHGGDAFIDRAAVDRVSPVPTPVRSVLHACGHSMKLMTWNVQWCRGVDLKVDPARIVSEAKRIADFDVLCLQEIADNFPDPDLGGSAGEDQFAVLATMLPGFTAVPGVAVDQPAKNGRRRRFGNMIFSRLPVKQVYRHLLPYPSDPGVPGMPRIALEAVVSAPLGDLRVMTTHLEYHSVLQRRA